MAVAEKIGVVETAAAFLKRRTDNAQPADLLPFLENAANETPPVGDEVSG